MATETLLGIRVYIDQNTAIPLPKDWRDIHSFFNTLKNVFIIEKPYLAHVESRIKPLVDDKSTKKLLASLRNGQKLPLEALKKWKVKLGGVGGGCNLTYAPYQPKAIVSLSELNIVGTYQEPVRKALQCKDPGCVAYQREILSLLKDSGEILINAAMTIGDILLKEYGQIAVPEKVKVYTVLPARKVGMPVEIRVKFASKNYKNHSTAHYRHVEILSGILFEAGNIYTGNFGSHPSQDIEATVAVHNSRQVARIAKTFPITQNDWRNHMQLLFATDINTLSYQCTPNYVSMFKNSSHDAGANLKLGY